MESKLRNQAALLEMVFTLLISSLRPVDMPIIMELELLHNFYCCAKLLLARNSTLKLILITNNLLVATISYKKDTIVLNLWVINALMRNLI